MEILIIGSEVNLKETRQKFGDQHHYIFKADHAISENQLTHCDIVFDFIISEQPSAIGIYKASSTVFVNTSLITLSQLGVHQLPITVFGFCGMPTFVNREILEVTSPNNESLDKLKDICEKLNTRYQVVSDTIGLVTPRVICMIINEAFYTVEEGTATREDIDKAMKLGTNYPYGPFEWCERIGSRNVCALLDAVFADTGEDRYKVCDALRKEIA